MKINIMSIREMYEKHGVKEYYEKGEYENLHEEVIHEHLEKIYPELMLGDGVLDLGCGTGLVTKWLLSKGYDNITGCDPYLNTQYQLETGRPCLDFSFEDIANGELFTRQSLVICSFSLHLCPESFLHNCLYNLNLNSEQLLIISPHKRPDCHGVWHLQKEMYFSKVRTKLYWN